MRECPTYDELLATVAALPPEKAAKILAAAHPVPRPSDAGAGVSAPPPLYTSWEHYLEATTLHERREWCRRKAKRANLPRLMSGDPRYKVTTDIVWDVLETARGRCTCCGSLALERRPSKPNGAPDTWEHVGRRIGSLGHVVGRFNGGDNDRGNLTWSCLWCNTWIEERRPGATDHGAIA